MDGYARQESWHVGKRQTPARVSGKIVFTKPVEEHPKFQCVATLGPIDVIAESVEVLDSNRGKTGYATVTGHSAIADRNGRNRKSRHTRVLGGCQLRGK